MEFEIIFYKDAGGDSPIEEFLLELAKRNRVLVARTRALVVRLRPLISTSS